MKPFVVLLAVLLPLQFVYAQKKDTSISIDQLQVPSSPAFNMLNISPDNIERPKNPTDFAIALSNATSGFTTLPKDYAIELAPFWIFARKKASFEDFKDNKPAKNILQTMLISAGTTGARSQVDSSEYRKMAFALKFSVFRGEMGDEFKQWNDSIGYYLQASAEIAGKIAAQFAMQQNEKMQRFTDSLEQTGAPRWQDSIKAVLQATEAFNNGLHDKLVTDSLNAYNRNIAVLRSLISRTDFRRYGFKMDLAAGMVLDYPDSTFQRSYVSRVSGWLTAGWEDPSFNVLGVLRFSQNFMHAFRNDSGKIVNNIRWAELDYGLRIYKDFTDKLTLSAEAIHRLSRSNSSDRFMVAVNYKIGKNQNLSFSYGKNFDNTYYKEGNLVAALNLMIGLGSARPVK